MIKYNQISIKNHNEVVRDIREEMKCERIAFWIMLFVFAAIIVFLANKLGAKESMLQQAELNLIECHQEFVQKMLYDGQPVILNGE